MRTFLLFCVLHIGLFGLTQERCATSGYAELQRADNPTEAQKIAAAENFLLKRSSSPAINARTEMPAVIKVPVVVHVVYSNASQNISEAQVKSQIDALNRDFRRTNNDTTNTPLRFQSIAADVQIEFYLATADPKGRATNGIVRKSTNVSNWLTNDKIKFSAQGGDDAWDTKSYLNIWVGNLVSGAGYATSPGSEATKDGVVINTSAFGVTKGSGTYPLGRTAVHEVGHWLGLKHIWGDTQCGDDQIGDTPQQGWYTQNCPTGFRSSCNNGEAGDMYMNYMDYTADACMNLFTAGQKSRMRSCFAEGGPRESFVQSKGLKEPWMDESALPEPGSRLLLYPNPAKEEININMGMEGVGKVVSIVNMNGVVVQSVKIQSAVQKLSLSSLKAGLYFIKGEGFTEKFIRF
jgi:hypothetical protein